MKKIILGAFLFAASVNVCSQTAAITIDPSVKYQTIESFGASDCWSVKDIGLNWSDEVRERVVKELFSSGVRYDGSPEGIALTQWRFNLGAGSENDASVDYSRRTETFFDSTGNGYDWTKQAGQQWFMDRARGYGCTDFVAFSNSPLVQFTKNGKGYANPKEPEANLQDDKYDDYAEYCADVMQYFEKQGKGFKYFSPVNEPQYDWDGPSQEGSPWQNQNIKKIVVELDKAFLKRNLTTKLLITEAGDWTKLYETSGRASNQIYEFFDKNSANYIGNLPSLAPVIGSHSYWTTGTNSGMKNVRVQAYNKAKEYDLSVFQTEYSMLSGGEGLPEDLGQSTLIDNALFLGKVIYSDLEHAQVTSWTYWTAFGIDLWGHKNRFMLTAVVPGDGPYGSMSNPGTSEATKNLWVLGNYSYFIRPGYTRIRMKGAADMAGLMGTAYLAPDSSRIVAVYVNAAYENKNITTQFQNMDLVPVSNKRYVTNSLYDLKKYGSASSEIYEDAKVLAIPSRSVTTIVYDLKKKESSIMESLHDNGFRVYPNPVNKGELLEINIPAAFSAKEGTLVIGSLNGSVVLQKDLLETNSRSFRVDVPSNVPSGTYLVQLKSADQQYQEKIIIR